MAQIITAHGFKFSVESDGWYGHGDDCDEARSNLETALSDMDPVQVAALHASLVAADAGDAEYPDEAVFLCNDAVNAATAEWADPSAPSLMLGAH